MPNCVLDSCGQSLSLTHSAHYLGLEKWCDGPKHGSAFSDLFNVPAEFLYTIFLSPWKKHKIYNVNRRKSAKGQEIAENLLSSIPLFFLYSALASKKW